VLLTKVTRLAAVSALLGLAACSGSGVRACPADLRLDGLQVDLSNIVAAHPSARPDLRVCIGEAPCQTLRHVRFTEIVVGGLHSAEAVSVRVRLDLPRGRLLFMGQTEVTPVRDPSAGPGCPPAGWRARVVATGKHTLTPRPFG
jgi:hypothetical protein